MPNIASHSPVRDTAVDDKVVRSGTTETKGKERKGQDRTGQEGVLCSVRICAFAHGVRRHHDVVGLCQVGDLLHLQDAACPPRVRLHHVDDPLDPTWEVQ